MTKKEKVILFGIKYGAKKGAIGGCFPGGLVLAFGRAPLANGMIGFISIVLLVALGGAILGGLIAWRGTGREA